MSDNVMREKAFFNAKVTNLARGQLTCGSIDLWENCGRGIIKQQTKDYVSPRCKKWKEKKHWKFLLMTAQYKLIIINVHTQTNKSYLKSERCSCLKMC